eukprot:c20900_g1_i1.p1 GENE.c20900_g1_i1~~c20900_g1_i1.p1  ORF type:complete len:699 (+),score=140.15 c20900_g1_i1:31-2097(+)
MWQFAALLVLAGSVAGDDRSQLLSSSCSEFAQSFAPGLPCDVIALSRACECVDPTSCLDKLMWPYHSLDEPMQSRIRDIVANCDFRTLSPTERADECFAAVTDLEKQIPFLQGCPVHEIGASCLCDSPTSCAEKMQNLRAMTPASLIESVNTIRVVCELENISPLELMSCGAMLKGVPDDPTECPAEKIYQACPCKSSEICMIMLKMFRPKFKPKDHPKLDKLVEICLAQSKAQGDSFADAGLVDEKEQFMAGISTGVLGGLITGKNVVSEPLRSPFDNLPYDEHYYLVHLLWWGSQYAYDKNRHYKSRAEGSEGLVSMNEVVHVEAFEQEHGADALAALIRPDMSYVPGPKNPKHPSVWYCEKYHTPSHCNPNNMEYYHVAFRGLRYDPVTIINLKDMQNMKQRHQPVPCRFGLSRAGRSLQITITKGTCLMLRALVKAGLMHRLVGLANQDTGKNKMFVFHGLSFGGVLAQAATMLYQKVLVELHQSNNLDLTAAGRKVELGVILFGSPRVGDHKFLDYYNDMPVHTDQFITYSYYSDPKLANVHSRDTELQYDPIAFFPRSLAPTGNLHTIVTYMDNHELLHTEIRHDLFLDEDTNFYVSLDQRDLVREIPEATWTGSFQCLHDMSLYQASLEHRFPTPWRKPECGFKPRTYFPRVQLHKRSAMDFMGLGTPKKFKPLTRSHTVD